MKTIIAIALLTMSFASHASSFQCKRYYKGEYKGQVSVTANSKAEAEVIAMKKYAEMGQPVDRLECVY